MSDLICVRDPFYLPDSDWSTQEWFGNRERESSSGVFRSVFRFIARCFWPNSTADYQSLD